LLRVRKIPGKLWGMWDGSPSHRRQASKTFLAPGAAKRIQVERIPASAPAGHPDEGVWTYRKRVELATGCCRVGTGSDQGTGTPAPQTDGLASLFSAGRLSACVLFTEVSK
jgi:hypothetical protein